MLAVEEQLVEFISTLNPNQTSNIDQRRSQLTFINSLVDFINFENILDVYSHDTRDSNTWCGVESWCCEDSHGFICDVDIRSAWHGKIFQQNLVDYDWRESTLLSKPNKKSRYKLIIYLCEDTVAIPNGRELHATPTQFLIGQYWQEIYHLYLKVPNNDFLHSLKLEKLPTQIILDQSKPKPDLLPHQSKVNTIEVRKSLDYDCRPLVSIVTVVKNGEKYLEQTIQSVINQTYSNIEYIIIDGGSTDGTLDIIRKYESEISYWISEPDEGISDAFNKGVSHSHGLLIGILSADDLYFQASVIESIVDKSKVNPTISFYFGDCLYDSEKNISKLKGDDKYAEKLGFFMPHIHHPTVLMKREVLIRTPFSTSYKLCMDYHLFVRLNKQGFIGSRYNGSIAIVRNCGVSNRLYYRTQKEVFRASTEQGTSKILAGLIYIIFIARYWIKDKLTIKL
jgi:Glycosyl transferase family 2